jgi:hypothetical protein
VLVALCAEKKGNPYEGCKTHDKMAIFWWNCVLLRRALLLRDFDNIEYFCQHNDPCLLGFLFVGTLNRVLYKKEPKTGRSTEVYNTAGVRNKCTILTPVTVYPRADISYLKWVIRKVLT